MHNLQTRRQRTLLCHAVCVGMRGSRRKKYVPNIRSHHPHESVGVCVCAFKEKPKKYGHTRFHVHHKLSVNSRSPPYMWNVLRGYLTPVIRIDNGKLLHGVQPPSKTLFLNIHVRTIPHQFPAGWHAVAFSHVSHPAACARVTRECVGRPHKTVIFGVRSTRTRTYIIGSHTDTGVCDFIDFKFVLDHL